ncbi:hypothetical protein QBC33DRAFT_131557 [Phialemonium atrogriseum]|uniref:Uncharacterized protein n=1 Tax=Phialemonium atrogriseum TaxID=1093897 RepID=A0AAJ0BYY5_9PEZI|nr:uncharacterized protein QBC33DRAFT_131557 [Phialemonium atrogriseum]KAK1765694.1 hypothetical protein QBC33DRAFT_131557 [Phialemonium atrogriseum]
MGAKPYDLEAQQANKDAPGGSTVTYMRSGRGGAGNFVQPSTREESQPADDGDDTQRTKVTATAAAAASGAGPKAGLTGRGGAGNWASTGQTAGPDQMARPKTGPTGRGGAGNWAASAGQAAQAELMEKKTKEDLEARVLQDVEGGLAMPPPTYRQRGRKEVE